METQGDPDLAVMDAVTSSGSIEELLVAQTAGRMILGREDQALSAFEAAEAALEDWKDEVREARDEVAEQTEAAGRNLLAIRGLFTDARDTRAEVARLVDRSRSARHAAVKARQHDRAALERLKKREARIKREILGSPSSRAAGERPDLQRQHRRSAADAGQRAGDLAVRLADAPDLRLLGPARRHRLRRRLRCAPVGGRVRHRDQRVLRRGLRQPPLPLGRHVNGANLTLVYNHLSSYNVPEGAHVGRGDVVGYVGSTGWSTGCHLHFTVLRNGEPVDPMNYL